MYTHSNYHAPHTIHHVLPGHMLFLMAPGIWDRGTTAAGCSVLYAQCPQPLPVDVTDLDPFSLGRIHQERNSVWFTLASHVTCMRTGLPSHQCPVEKKEQHTLHGNLSALISIHVCYYIVQKTVHNDQYHVRCIYKFTWRHILWYTYMSTH